jgi:hypothetical protein
MLFQLEAEKEKRVSMIVSKTRKSCEGSKRLRRLDEDARYDLAASSSC